MLLVDLNLCDFKSNVFQICCASLFKNNVNLSKKFSMLYFNKNYAKRLYVVSCYLFKRTKYFFLNYCIFDNGKIILE